MIAHTWTDWGITVTPCNLPVLHTTVVANGNYCLIFETCKRLLSCNRLPIRTERTISNLRLIRAFSEIPFRDLSNRFFNWAIWSSLNSVFRILLHRIPTYMENLQKRDALECDRSWAQSSPPRGEYHFPIDPIPNLSKIDPKWNANIAMCVCNLLAGEHNGL